MKHLIHNLTKITQKDPYATTAAYSTIRCGRPKQNTKAAKQLTVDNDNNATKGNMHVLRYKYSCNNVDCHNQKCVTLCGSLEFIETAGHFTHQPGIR